MMDSPLIEFQNVSKRFNRKTVLHHVDLKIYKGEVTTIIGKSGVGKSVLLKHIIGLLEPDEGCILLNGQPLSDMSAQQRKEHLGKISYMFQNNALFDSLTVFENVALPLRHTTKLSRSQIAERVMERIRQTELEEVAQQYPAELSGGMQKRVALARALVTDPNIVLFDEPTTGQDPIRRNAILSMISEYQHRFGFTAVLISHDLPDVFFISNRIIVLYEGAVIFEGTPEAFDDFDHPFRYEFIHSLESLQHELTGLYSRRYFKIRYQTELHNYPQFTNYALITIAIQNLDEIQSRLGHTATQELVRVLGGFISKHFSEVGGFSTRYGVDRFCTILPYSNLEEANGLAENFAKSFLDEGIGAMQKFIQTEAECEDGVHVILAAGIAQGDPELEIESIMETAQSTSQKLLDFNATCRGKKS